jgi:hypothetical protein
MHHQAPVCSLPVPVHLRIRRARSVQAIAGARVPHFADAVADHFASTMDTNWRERLKGIERVAAVCNRDYEPLVVSLTHFSQFAIGESFKCVVVPSFVFRHPN